MGGQGIPANGKEVTERLKRQRGPGRQSPRHLYGGRSKSERAWDATLALLARRDGYDFSEAIDDGFEIVELFDEVAAEHDTGTPPFTPDTPLGERKGMEPDVPRATSEDLPPAPEG